MGFFSFIKNIFQNSKTTQEEPVIRVEIKTHEVEIKQKTEGPLVMADIGDYQSASGGYVNFTTFKVVGTNANTGRKKNYQVEAKNEAEALNLAKNSGLIEPFTITVIPNREATDRQINYAHSLGAKFPSDVCFDDISCIIDRILSEDENPPNTGLVQWALDSGIHFSRFVNQESLIDHMLGQLKGPDRWSFYSYLIYCEISDLEESDARKLSCYNELVSCGKMIDSRPDIQKSLRENDRYNHYTKGYKAIKQWFTDHHII